MPKASRDKGARRELEAARLIGATKISRMYGPGPDLKLPDGRYVEVKAQADGWKKLHRWLDDDAQILMLKADYKPWLVTMTIGTFLDIMEEHDEHNTSTDTGTAK